MSFEKEKENGALNSNNYFNHSLHQMFNSGGTAPFNSSPRTSPSVANYSLSMYGMPTATTNTTASTSTNTTNSITTTTTTTGNANANSFGARFSQSQTLLGGTDGTTTPHLARQLTYAQISRQSSSPHHHARAAAAMARNTPVSSAVTITDPNDPTKFANGHGTFKTKKTVVRTGEENQSWTLLDMGGMGLKNVSPAVCNYTFLTALYMNHNNLTYLMPALAQLTQLRILDISGNKLTMLPPELGMLIQLRELLAFDNNLVTLPTEFGNLYQLETLGLEGNPIQSEIKNMLIKDGTQAVIMSLRESAPVAAAPPPREWIPVECDPSDDESEKFIVLCYNILCQKYATSQAYGYTPSWALNWDYRRDLILTEIGNSNADIICLQEVEMALYEDHFKEYFMSAGFDSVFFQKTRAKTMTEKERRGVDGCATFYRTSRFGLVKHEFVEYNQKALQRPDFKSADIYNRVMNKDNIAVFLMLEDKVTQQRVLVANTHIHWDPLFADVKLVQMGVMMEELQRFGQKYLNEGTIHYDAPSKMPTIVCGDFNSAPDSGVYEFLSKGSIAQDHDDFGDHSYGTYTTDGLTHPYTLKSSYGTVHDMTFTNLTPGFKGVLDYIWYSTNTLEVNSVLGPIDGDYLSKVIGFPNAHFPSDHISIMSEIKYKPNSKKEPVKPADFSSTIIKNNRH